MPQHGKGGRPNSGGVDVPAGHKYCPLCEDVLPVDRFYSRPDRSLSSYCKPCTKAYRRRSEHARQVLRDIAKRYYLRKNPTAKTIVPPPLDPSQYGPEPAAGPEIIHWHDRDNMTFQQIAERLGISTQGAARLYKKWKGTRGSGRTPSAGTRRKQRHDNE